MTAYNLHRGSHSSPGVTADKLFDGKPNTSREELIERLESIREGR